MPLVHYFARLLCCFVGELKFAPQGLLADLWSREELPVQKALPFCAAHTSFAGGQ